MAREFPLSVVAPDKSVVEQSVTSVVAPGTEGYFGVLIGHSPMIASLKPGLLEYLDVTGNRHYVYIGGGFAEVGADGMTVLADEAEQAKEIDVERAAERLEAARRSLSGGGGPADSEEAVLEVDRAMQRLSAARAARKA